MSSMPVASIGTHPSGLPLHDSKMALARLWLDLDAARVAISRGQMPAILHTARILMSSLDGGRVHAELAHGAARFAEGLEERTDAEQWAFFAVAARATLEHVRNGGDRAIARGLERLDEAFEDVREAVLLLAPEDFKEALATTTPNTRAWWGERARLDGGLREIELERTLGDLADSLATT